MQTIEKETLDRYMDVARQQLEARQAKPVAHKQLIERMQAELPPRPETPPDNR